MDALFTHENLAIAVLAIMLVWVTNLYRVLLKEEREERRVAREDAKRAVEQMAESVRDMRAIVELLKQSGA